MLLSILKKDDIPECYRHTPIEKLLLYHNLNYPFDSYNNAEMLILMCIDNRIMLRLPDNFSYVVRNSGAKMENVVFPLSFAVTLGGIKTIAVIGHSGCRMKDLKMHKLEFVKGLSGQGWETDRAENFFLKSSPVFEMGNIIDSIITETMRLRSCYLNVLVAPLYYYVEDKKLYFIKEDVT